LQGRSFSDEVELGAGRVEAARKLARWCRQGWLRRARRGLYVPVPVEAENPSTWSQDPLLLGNAVWSPCYFTGWTSASHWGMTEQVFRTTVVRTVRRVRTSEQALLDQEYLVGHVGADGIWGVVPLWREGQRLQLADAARTIVDVLDDPRLAGGIRTAAEFVAAYLAESDAANLIETADRLGNGAVFKRLGFIASALGLGKPGLVDECRSRVRAGISLLDPSAAPGGDRVGEWGLRVNVRIRRESPS
jgi:predicted transcriptional regulator of viral defense system